MKGPLVSVVTPVYNGEAYLEECIESVLAQTYESWEHVIVDNCSTDRTPKIARSYEAREPRIRVVAPAEFVPATENANRALREIARDSKYCKVLHADDWLFPECLERMVDLAERHPSVGIVSAYRLEGTRVSLDGLDYRVSVIPGRELGRSALLGGPYPYLLGSPTSLLIRADLVCEREAFYNPENPFQDDQESCLELLQESDLGFVHQVLTYQRRHERSISSHFVSVGAQALGYVHLVQKFGPIYLTREEYERRLAAGIISYALFLVRHLPRMRQRKVREFHRKALVQLLRSVNAREVARGIVHKVRKELRRMRRADRGLAATA